MILNGHARATVLCQSVFVSGTLSVCYVLFAGVQQSGLYYFSILTVLSG